MGTCRDTLATCMETDDVLRANAGMVYIYPNGMNTAAGNIVKIAPPTADTVANGFFGHDVDIAGDTIVVGTRYHGGTGLRKAYIYARGDFNWKTAAGSSGVPVTPAVLSPATLSDFDQGFGEGVAISADGNTIAVVGADDTNNTGRVVVYEKQPADSWMTDATHADEPELRIGNGYSNERAIAISGDGSTIAAGTPTGWIYVYKEPAGGWADQIDGGSGTGGARIRNRGMGGSGTQFAKYLALSDDGTTLVVSNHYQGQTSPRNVPGTIRVYVRPGTSWESWHVDTQADSEEATTGFDLTVSSPRNQDVFGQYIAIKGDGSEIASGRHYRQEGDFRGSVVTFTKPATGWASDSTPDEEFLGPRVNARMGWATTYDKTLGTLYSGIRESVEGGNLLTVYQITR